MGNNVNWGSVENPFGTTVLYPGDEAGDGVCQDAEHGVQVDDVVIYSATAAGLRRWALGVAAVLEDKTDPPVVFDEAAFQAWLADTSDGKVPPAFVETSYSRQEKPEAGWLAEQALSAVQTVATVWRYADKVSDVRVWATAGPEGGEPDGSIAGEVTLRGVRLSLGRITAHELLTIGDEQRLPGSVAAAQVLSAIADAVEVAVTHARGCAVIP